MDLSGTAASSCISKDFAVGPIVKIRDSIEAAAALRFLSGQFFGPEMGLPLNLIVARMPMPDARSPVTSVISPEMLVLILSEIVQVTIADNDQDISATTLLRIFESFFTTKDSTGNGLGLWLCKQIIEKHGGSILVRSRTCEQHGTTFSIVLPVSAQ